MIKKLLSITLLLSLAFTLSACNNMKRAETFNSTQINNGYNNYLAGGKMAYLNNELYVVYNTDTVMSLGTYKVNNNGAKLILKNDDNQGAVDGKPALETPEFYQINDEIYVSDIMHEDFEKYDVETDTLVEADFDVANYVTENLSLTMLRPEDDYPALKVKYKGNEEYIIDEPVFDYCVCDDMIYFVNYDYRLFKNNPADGSPKSEFLSYLTEGCVSKLHAFDGYIYFNNDAKDYFDETKTGLYIYSIADNSLKHILEREINCLNSYNGKLYIAADDGVYVAKPNAECKKISNLKASEIYILDTEWIYLLDDENGKIYRITPDGKNSEILDFVINKN